MWRKVQFKDSICFNLSESGPWNFGPSSKVALPTLFSTWLNLNLIHLRYIHYPHVNIQTQKEWNPPPVPTDKQSTCTLYPLKRSSLEWFKVA
jgi:hypothetical protein